MKSKEVSINMQHLQNELNSLASSFDLEKLNGFISKVNSSLLTKDHWFSNHCIASDEFYEMNRVLLKSVLDHSALINEDFEAQYKSYLKVYLVKTNFKFLKDFYLQVFEYLSRFLDTQSFQANTFGKVISLIQNASGGNLSINPIRCLSFLGEKESGMFIKCDKIIAETHMELNQNFTYLTIFFSDFGIWKVDDLAVICSFFDDTSENGYSLHIRNDELYFAYSFRYQGNCVKNEYMVVDDIYQLTHNKWNTLMMNCAYDSGSKTTHMSFVVNDVIKTVKCPMNFKYPYLIKQNLKLFTNISGSVSLACAIKRCLLFEEYKKLRCSIMSQGVVSILAYEYFARLFEKELANNDFIFLFTGLSRCKKTKGFSKVLDHIKQTEADCGVTFNLTNNHQSNYDNCLMGLDVVSGIFCLFNYIKDAEDLESLIKTIASIFSNERIIQIYQNSLGRNVYSELFATILTSNCSIYLNKKSVESLIGIVNMQDQQYASYYLNYLLLGFTTLDKFLSTEEITKMYFDLLMQHLDFNSSLAKMISAKNLIEALVLLVHSKNYLNLQKAVQMARIVLLCIPVNKDMASVDIFPILLMMSQVKTCSGEQQSQIINSLLTLIKINEHRKQYKQLYAIALGNLLHISTDSSTIEKIMKHIFNLENQPEETIIAFWRMKVANVCNIDVTKEVFCAYNQANLKLTKSERFTKYLLRLIFDLQPHEEYYGDNMELIKSKKLNVFYEISISLDDGSLEKILQAHLISLKQFTKSFIRNIKESNFLHWILAISYFHFPNRKHTPIFDLASKLMINYLIDEISLLVDTTAFGQIIDLMSYMNNEKDFKEATLLIVSTLFKDMVNRDIIISNENSLNQFLIYFFYLYFRSLRSSTQSPLYKEMIGHIIISLHKNVNNNTNPMLPLAMQKSIATVINIKNNIHNLLQNASYKMTKAMEFDSVLKMQSYLFIDIVKYCFQLKVPEIIATGLMLIREYFANTVYFLEKNRGKLRADKISEIEDVLHKVLLFLSEHPDVYDNLREIRESLILFSNPDVTPHSFCCKVMKMCGIDSAEASDSEGLVITLMSKLEILKGEDKTLGPNTSNDDKAFIEERLNEIKNILKDNKTFGLQPTISDPVKDKLNHYRLSNSQEYKGIYEKFLNESLLDLKISFQSFRNTYHKLYKQQWQPGNLLYKKSLDKFIYHFNEGPMLNEKFDPSLGSTVKIKHSKVTVKNGQRPFLKIKPGQYYKGLSLKNQEEYIDSFSFIDYFNFKGQSYFPCQRIFKLNFIPGFITLNRVNSTIEFFINFQADPKESGIELAYYRFKLHKKIKYTWSLYDVKEIHEFKFFNRRMMIEFFMVDRQSFLIEFKTRQELDDFVTIFFESNKEIKLRTIDTSKIFEMKNYRKRWLSNHISNFEYLMKINSLASRSLEDFAQYPIFPLVLKKAQPGIVLRELNKPVGMIGDQRRVSIFIKRFQLDDPFSEHPNYFYGSHYSSPAIVFNFLIRLRPYNKGCKAIQNGVFDLPDRLFFSINLMLKNVMEEMGDVRELIPELFYLPTLFVNSNNFDFGINQNGERIHNVIMPEGFQDSPYKFVYSLRRILESEETSKMLGEWIDLIFGTKQIGQEAVENNNVYFYLTYEDSIKKLKFEDAKHRTALETQIYHFGQIPFKLFHKKHPNKIMALDLKTIISSNVQVKYFVKKRQDNTIPNDPILYMKCLNYYSQKDKNLKNKIFVVKQKCFEVYRFNSLQSSSGGKPPFEFFLHEQINTFKLNEELVKMGFDTSYRDAIEIYSPYKLVYGGCLGGFLNMFSLKTYKHISRHLIHEWTITKLILSTKNVLLSADISGIICISSLDPIRDSVTPLKTIYSFFDTDITSLRFSHSDENFFLVNSGQSLIEIRSILQADKTIFRLPNLLENRVKELELSSNNLFMDAQISFGYIGCVVIYSYMEHRNTIHTFSFDGRLIARYLLLEEDNVQMNTMTIVTDEYFKDNLILANSKGDLYLFDLPLLENGRRISSSQKIEITAILPFNKNRVLLLADQNGLIDVFSVTANG